MREHSNTQYTKNRYLLEAKLTKSHLIMWLSANCIETTGKTDEILCIFSLRTKQSSEKQRLTRNYLRVGTGFNYTGFIPVRNPV